MRPALAVVCVLYVAVMVVATHMSLSRVSVPEWRLLPFDKVFHFSAYAGLAFLLATLAAAIWTGTQGNAARGCCATRPCCRRWPFMV